jgi:glucosamine--fructose-6-phosphate aminotransferase (isomerizing)
MCGIVGILGRGPVAPRLLEALKRLEYRGYDSAGIATLDGGVLGRRRASGKLANLQSRLASEPLAGDAGIGHTRWATHGAPTEANAHPHATDRVAVVHNGIIENFQALRREIEAAGRRFESETDTEVIAHLLTMALAAGMSPADALSATLKRLEGAFALAVIFAGEDNLMLAARRGSPLAVGHGDGEMFLGSDAIALAPFTQLITYLQDGDWAVITRQGLQVFTDEGDRVDRPVTRGVAAEAALDNLDKGDHQHFMRKEIEEQPAVISRTIAHYVDFSAGVAKLPAGVAVDFKSPACVTMTACGTASYAAQIGKYWFERLARLPVEIDIASEFRYREPPLPPGGIALFVSQSGETADTLAGLRYASRMEQRVGAIVNVPTSTIARESDFVLPTLAGPEIGVASTKAFTCQLAVLFALAVYAARQRDAISTAEEQRLVRALTAVPRHVAAAMNLEPEIESLAGALAEAKCVLYLGRGTSYPLALEGALKLKEISYIHAEGYAAGELKHGPIALIDEQVPVIVVAPHDHLFEKTVSNMQEVAARGGQIILLTDPRGAEEASLKTLRTLVLPEVPFEIAPIVYSIPIQLLAYHTARARGADIDQPRNLAKSVTVE